MTLDLTKGNILRALWKMALPLILSSFIQTAYAITDMFWIGHLGSEKVAAVGACSFFVWLCNAIAYLPKTGAEITISQALGAKDTKRAISYARHARAISYVLALLLISVFFLFSKQLIGLFNFDKGISQIAVNYFLIVIPGLFFTFNSYTFDGIYNGSGDTTTPFKIIAIGLIINIILDPILIYGIGIIPRLETNGAAIATTLSEIIVFAIFYYKLKSSIFFSEKKGIFKDLVRSQLVRLFKLGLPVSSQSALFAMFSLTLATLAAKWGPNGVTAQSIGSQIESITWMTASGFATALASFVGQNYGAKDLYRIKKGYRIAMTIGGIIGIFSSFLFIFLGHDIFSLFVEEANAIEVGGNYLKILGFSQLFMMVEIVSQGAFNGCGYTTPPALVGIFFTGLRIPLAYFLCSIPEIGLNGIWLSITISSIFKGSVTSSWFMLYLKRVKL